MKDISRSLCLCCRTAPVPPNIIPIPGDRVPRDGIPTEAFDEIVEKSKFVTGQGVGSRLGLDAAP